MREISPSKASPLAVYLHSMVASDYTISSTFLILPIRILISATPRTHPLNTTHSIPPRPMSHCHGRISVAAALLLSTAYALGLAGVALAAAVDGANGNGASALPTPTAVPQPTAFLQVVIVDIEVNIPNSTYDNVTASMGSASDYNNGGGPGSASNGSASGPSDAGDYYFSGYFGSGSDSGSAGNFSGNFSGNATGRADDAWFIPLNEFNGTEDGMWEDATGTAMPGSTMPSNASTSTGSGSGSGLRGA